jgi:hypothetical protein
MSKSPRRNKFGDAHASLESLIARAESPDRKYPIPRKKKVKK